jgi:hypothetical protein
MKTTPHLRLSRDISSISSTLTSTISKRLLNIIYRRLKVQTTVSLSLKLGLLIRILLLRYSEKSGILLKNRDSNLFSIKVFFSFISTLKSPNSEFDIYQYYSAKSKKYEIIDPSFFVINVSKFKSSNKIHSLILILICILFFLLILILRLMSLLKKLLDYLFLLFLLLNQFFLIIFFYLNDLSFELFF